jgi:hypothetical protein
MMAHNWCQVLLLRSVSRGGNLRCLLVHLLWLLLWVRWLLLWAM